MRRLVLAFGLAIALVGGSWVIPLVLEQPVALEGLVRDEYSGLPIPGARIEVGDVSVESDALGKYSLDGVGPGEIVHVEAPGYEGTSLGYSGQRPLEVLLRPNTLSGVVRDAATGEPIVEARLFLEGGSTAQSDEGGGFSLTDVPPQPRLVVMAPGYRQAIIQVGRTVSQEVELRPLVVKGLYLSFYALGWQERRRHLFDLVDVSELNAVVMDVKGDRGLVNSDVGVPLSKEIGAEVELVPGLAEQLAWLKERDIYVIARIVVFKDSILARELPNLAVKDSGTGTIYVDCEGQRWVDPFNREVWDYNIALAEEAARLGFDEIQFDYVRFPSDCISGRLLYSKESNPESRVAAIAGFLEAAGARLRPLGAYVAADTFGWTMFREDDMGIGQIIERFAPHLDYLCPMVYPSTWAEGSLGLDYPAAHPYRIVFRSLKRGRERLAPFPMLRLRPWLQDFDDYGRRKLAYGAAQVMAQRRAAKEAGVAGFMLWNPGAVYSEGAMALESPQATEDQLEPG